MKYVRAYEAAKNVNEMQPNTIDETDGNFDRYLREYMTPQLSERIKSFK